MSKKIWIMLGIVLVVIIATVVTGIAVICHFANKTKTSITSSKFETIMKDNQYKILDAKDQFAAYDYIKDAKIALQDDGNYQIEFYVMGDETQASLFFENNKTIFEREVEEESNAKSTNSQNFKNGELYKVEASGKYMCLSRIDNTMIYVNVKSEYKTQVDSILKKLGY